MYTIATLHDLRRHLNLAPTDTSSDADLLRCLQQASHIIESLTRRQYCPTVESRRASIQPANPEELVLANDLLALTALSNGDGSPISLDDVRRTPSHPDIPASVLHLVNGARFVYRQTSIHAIGITGVWGWHDRWSRAWLDSGDTIQDDPLPASAAALSVADADGTDRDGISPRFQVGMMLRIESEYLRVTAIDRAGNRLTALRGVQGTPTAAHPLGTPIETYQAAPAVRDLCVRYAAMLLNSVGALGSESEPLLEHLRRLSA